MFPNHTKSFFNQFMKERFPNEGSRSYINEWYGRFITIPNYNIHPKEDNEGNSVEPCMSNFYFIHDEDSEESFYPYVRCDFESTDVWFKIMRERLDKLEEAHNESKAEYNKRKWK